MALPPLPPFLPPPGRVLPFPVQRFLVEPALRMQCRESWLAGELEFLRGRFLRVTIADLGIVWHITLGTGGPVMVYGNIEPDAAIEANLRGFIRLARQEEDPDTLFFRRELSIGGDTDMALNVKNVLYAMEWLPEVRVAAETLERILPAGPAS